MSAPLGPEDDVVEMCAAVYAMPEQFRERGSRSGLPLMWAWPARLFQDRIPRRQQLLLAAAMAMVAERIGLAAARRRLRVLPGDGGRR